MKPMKIVSALLLAGLLFSIGCNKDKYTNGAAVVSGTVSYVNGATGTNDPASYANVHINYNSSTEKTPYDLTIKADSTGNFSIKLPTGSYYFSATYQDNYGFTYSTVQGNAVSINNTSDQVNNVAIIVQ